MSEVLLCLAPGLGAAQDEYNSCSNFEFESLQSWLVSLGGRRIENVFVFQMWYYDTVFQMWRSTWDQGETVNHTET